MNKPPLPEALQRTFGKTVRCLRKRIGLAQETLALETGIGRSYMGALERGLHSPSLNTIYQLLPVLRVSFPEFAQEFENNLHPRSKRQA